MAPGLYVRCAPGQEGWGNMSADKQTGIWWGQGVSGLLLIGAGAFFYWIGPLFLAKSSWDILPAIALIFAACGLWQIGATVVTLRRQGWHWRTGGVGQGRRRREAVPRTRLERMLRVANGLFFVSFGLFGLLIGVAYGLDNRLLPFADNHQMSMIVMAGIGGLALICFLFAPLMWLVVELKLLRATIRAAAPVLKQVFLPIDEVPVGAAPIPLSEQEMARMEAVMPEQAAMIARANARTMARPVKIETTVNGYARPWWRRPLSIVLRGYASAAGFFVVWWAYDALSTQRALSAFLAQAASTLVVVGVIVVVPLLLPAGWAVAPLFLPVARVRRPDSPLRHFWARCLMAGGYSIGLGVVAGVMVALLYSRVGALLWGGLFGTVAVIWLVCSLVAATISGIRRLVRRSTHLAQG